LVQKLQLFYIAIEVSYCNLNYFAHLILLLQKIYIYIYIYIYISKTHCLVWVKWLVHFWNIRKINQNTYWNISWESALSSQAHLIITKRWLCVCAKTINLVLFPIWYLVWLKWSMHFMTQLMESRYMSKYENNISLPVQCH
jgi:hypothetical protein